MRLNFRQGIVSHQEGGFLNINPSGNVDIFADNKPVTVTIGHKGTNYTHSEDNTFVDAWSGPFLSSENYWLYWDFNRLTFNRTFGITTLEPVAQSTAPGSGNTNIVSSVAGAPGIGSFVVEGQYILSPSKPFAVVSSTGNDGSYTVASSSYDSNVGFTTIIVNESVLVSGSDGEVTLDIDSFGNPLLVDGRMWYDTIRDIHFVRQSSGWTEVLRVFAAQITSSSTFISQSINSGNFTGTQTGDTSSVLSGRILFSERAGDPIRRDDSTFFTTEDQFFTNQSRVDGIRLESNVARAQLIEASAAEFTVVAWKAAGKIQVANYNDTGTTVVGMLTEGLLFDDVGAVIIQGVIQNPFWTWISSGIPVGSPLWISNGSLIGIDPHTTDVLTYPIGRVPVARVLSEDTIVFEQGLGGKGDAGPPGSLEDLPPATTTSLGAVTLVTPSSIAEQALVISDTDPRLSDARTPLPHTHAASSVIFTPGGGVLSNNVQDAIVELGTGKLDLIGGIMTGPLTLFGGPTNTLHAATKQYVDDLVSGLIWLDPICLLNMISDQVSIPPMSPFHSDAYVLPPGSSGVWSAIPAGNVVVWDSNSSMWLDRGAVTLIDPIAARFGIAYTSPTTPSGSFINHKNHIVQYDNTGNIDVFEIPVLNNAIFVCSTSSLHQFEQYAFDNTKWVQFNTGQANVGDDVTTVLNANVLSVKQYSDGGVNDVSHWQGLIPSDLSFSLEVLTDTDTLTSPPANGEALIYNSSTSKWEPGVVASGGGSPYTFQTLSACDMFDNTFWNEIVNMSWNGYKWIKTGIANDGIMQAMGTWVAGYEPQDVEVVVYFTNVAGSGTATVSFRDFQGAILGSATVANIVAGTEVTIQMNLNFGSNDIFDMIMTTTETSNLELRCITFGAPGFSFPPS